MQEGFSSLEEIAYVPASELNGIEEFTPEIVNELRSRARDVLITQAIVTRGGHRSGGAGRGPAGARGHGPASSRSMLASRGIVTREDLAEQAVDDLGEIDGSTPERAAKLIMAARAHWFDAEQQAK